MLLDVEIVTAFAHNGWFSPSVHTEGVKLTDIVPAKGTEENAEGLEAELKFEKTTFSVPANGGDVLYAPSILLVVLFP